MERLGFIHEKLDIKILILFILRRLPGIVAPIDLQDFTQQCDEGFGYFEYSDCLAELIESGLVIEEETGLRVSKRGADAAETVESSLPFSVRKRAEKIIAPEAERLRRLSMITAQQPPSRLRCCAVIMERRRRRSASGDSLSSLPSCERKKAGCSPPFRRHRRRAC